MTCKILIVEDQPLIALSLEDTVIELGYQSLGIAATKEQALAVGSEADVALVDVNLLDGPTGPEIGRELASRDVLVLFMTANPDHLGEGIPGTLGVITKPLMGVEMVQAIQYAVDRHDQREALCPTRLVEFA